MKGRTGAPVAVLLVTDTLIVGGLERIVVDLANALVERGHRVAVLAAPGGLEGALSRRVEWHPLEPGDGALRVARRIRAIVRDGGYEIVHAHQRGVALAARIGTVGLRVPVLEHVHNVFEARGTARLLSFRGHLLIACGSAVADMLVERFGRPRARVRLILNGVRDPFRHLDRAAPGGEVLRIVAAGRLTEQKDPLRFVRVVGEIVARLPSGSVQAVWWGEGPLLSDARAAVGEAGLDDVVSFPGLAQDLPARILAADLLLSTSRWEGLPLVALEALAAGRGIVLPDVGSCADAVAPGVGILYDPALADAQVAELVVRQVRDGAVQRWSGESRRQYEARFTFDRMLDQLQAVYREVQAARPRAVPAARGARPYADRHAFPGGRSAVAPAAGSER